jgi:hypothetical protein
MLQILYFTAAASSSDSPLLLGFTVIHRITVPPLSLASKVYAVYIVVGVICRCAVVALKTPPLLGSPSTTSGPYRRSSCLLAVGGSARRDKHRSGHTKVGGTATPVATETMRTDDDLESASEETRSADEELRVGKHKSAFRVFFFSSQHSNFTARTHRGLLLCTSLSIWHDT